MGSVTLRHTEFWGAVQTPTSSGNVTDKLTFKMGATGMKFLDIQGKCWDRATIHSVTIHWRTSVGTSADGSLVLGCEWDIGSTHPSDFAGVSILSPNRRSAVWQEFDVPVPSVKLMTRKYYECVAANGTAASEENTAFQLFYSVRGTANKPYGDIWCTYNITFEGPRAAP
jgi:hypothetical protein